MSNILVKVTRFYCCYAFLIAHLISGETYASSPKCPLVDGGKMVGFSHPIALPPAINDGHSGGWPSRRYALPSLAAD
jgi:hypothetical protein